MQVCATALDGYRATAVCMLGGGKAVAKATKTAEAILARCRFVFKMAGMEDFSGTHLHVIPSEKQFGDKANLVVRDTARDACLWLAVSHKDKRALGVFSRELASAGTSMAPGFSFLVGGRPSPVPVFKLVSFFYPKEKVNPISISLSADENTTFNTENLGSGNEKTTPVPPVPKPTEKGTNSYRLEDLACMRSGDKGDSCNIGVIARKPEFLPFIAEQLTTDAVFNYFSHVFPENATTRCAADVLVKRYYLPGINGLNFVLKSSLGGGGVASLRPDPQGKSYGQILGDFPITNVPKLL